jgi:hypothetical protein
MKNAAIGIRMHSGWGALVVVANNGGSLEIVERQRLTVVAPGTRGGNQPYHFAKSLKLPEAERFIEESLTASKQLALAAVGKLVDKLADQYHMVGSAILLASGRPLPSLAKILAAHPIIHAAEGEFFRTAISKACESLKLPVTGFRERELDEQAKASFGKNMTGIALQISTFGRTLGPPWTQDQKLATLAALMVLEGRRR